MKYLSNGVNHIRQLLQLSGVHGCAHAPVVSIPKHGNLARPLRVQPIWSRIAVYAVALAQNN